MTMSETQEEKTARNARVQARWDELWRDGKHGHYETLFRVVSEEVERERAKIRPAMAKAWEEGADAMELAAIEVICARRT